MSNLNKRYLTFKFDSTHHDLARRIATQLDSLEKRKHSYLNILAVCVVKAYLEDIGISIDIENTDSLNPIINCFDCSADIYIEDIGRLECIYVTGDESKFILPENLLGERIGYVVVYLPEVLNQAQLLGFVLDNEELSNKITETQYIFLNELQPIEELLGSLFYLEVEQKIIEEKIETGSRFLKSNDPVAVRVRSRLSIHAFDEIVAQFRDILDTSTQKYERRYKGRDILQNHIIPVVTKGGGDVSAVRNEGDNISERDNELNSELINLAEELLDKFEELWHNSEPDNQEL